MGRLEDYSLFSSANQEVLKTDDEILANHLWSEFFGYEHLPGVDILEASGLTQMTDQSQRKFLSLIAIRNDLSPDKEHLEGYNVLTAYDNLDSQIEHNIVIALSGNQQVSMKDRVMARYAPEVAQKLWNKLENGSSFKALETIEDVALLWKERFGDLHPTSEIIKIASSERTFINRQTLQRYGGVTALRGALGLSPKSSSKTSH